MHAYKHIEFKLLSLTYKALTTALHSLISVQPLVLLAPHLLTPFLDHLHLLQESSIAHFAMHHLISRTNCLSHSVSVSLA